MPPRTQTFRVEITDITGQFPLTEEKLESLMNIILSNNYRYTVEDITKIEEE